MPEEVYTLVSKEIPYNVGAYVPCGISHCGTCYDLKCVKKAKRKDRDRPISEMLLMMFRSAARDRGKYMAEKRRGNANAASEEVM